VAGTPIFRSPSEAYPFAVGDANQYQEINATNR
jgi:hypothetical protein